MSTGTPARGSTLVDKLRALLALPAGEETDERRRSRLLRVFLALSITVTALFLVFAWSAARMEGRLLTLGLLAWLVALGFAGRLGWTRSAAIAYLIGLWLFVTTAVWLFGAFRTPAASAYAAVALAGALFFGVRGAALASALVTLTCVAIAVADAQGWTPEVTHPMGTWMAISVLLASLLSVVGMALYSTAELRQAVAGLRDSEARFRSIVDSSPMAIHLYRLEPDGRLHLAVSNPAGRGLLSEGVDAGRGRTLEEAVPGLVGAEGLERCRRLCREGGSWESEVALDRDGSGERYEVHAFRTAPGLMAVIFLDVTERRRAEEERRQLEEQLRQSQKMEAVGRLAGGIAHDFNNLLMVVTGHGELLRRELADDEPRRRKVQHILGASDRAARLVRQLLAFGRQQPMEPQVVDLNARVAEAARLLRPLVGEDVKVVTRLDPRLVRARVDPAQIDQVLVNLAVNARDAMPRGGTLALETSNVDGPSGGSGGQGRSVALTVRDTGEGMDETTRAHAFEPFYTTKAGTGGTGLGLAMVYGIVQQSGGQISVESEPGRGSSFRIVLPGAAGPVAAVAAEAPAQPPVVSGETVLVVEDEPQIRSLACEMLEAHGYRTLAAGSGEEALGIAVRHPGPIHLLLSDVVMPGLAGPALADRFAALRPSTRVLFMSGYTGTDLARRGLTEDASPVLAKPFTSELLLRRVREAMDRLA